MDLRLKGWNQLGIVGTIYEEEDEDEDSSSTVQSIPSPEFTPSPQFSGEETRVLEKTGGTDVVIHVQNSCFRLHKDVLIARSGYLKRQLNEFSEITLSPPLKITAETIGLVTDFCYGNFVSMNPFNIAALRTAAELLEMTEINGPSDENLVQITEAYFRQVIAVNEGYLSIVLKSSFDMLPEAETTAFIVSRCIEALSLMGETDGDLGCLDGVKRLDVEDLHLILESTSQRLTECHDLLYRIIDLHLKENGGKVTEEQKIRMCNYIDCSILSPGFLMHAVQNPRMPLRFVVQAMFIEQLNTRRSIISAADHHPHQKGEPKDPATLGAILERDAALRQVAQFKAVMSVTNTRIRTLENELSGMRRILNVSENTKGRSASFRFGSEIDSKVERGQIGSISSLSIRDLRGKGGMEGSSTSEESLKGSVEKTFGRRLISGLKSAFRLQSLGSKKKGENKGREKLESSHENNDRGGGSNNNIVIIKKDQAFHRRSRSHS